MENRRRSDPLDAETIISATEDVLRRHGLAKATVLDVARVLGVSHGSVYRHFPTKAALREAVIRRWLHRIDEDLDAAARDHGPTPRERLCGLLDSMFAAKWAKAEEDPELFATFQALAAEHSEVSAAHVTGLLDRIRGIIADGLATGDFATRDPAVTARAVLDATNRFHNPAHVGEWQDPNIKAEAAAVVALILDGIRTR